jgi:hypothetical protein
VFFTPARGPEDPGLLVSWRCLPGIVSPLVGPISRDRQDHAGKQYPYRLPRSREAKPAQPNFSPRERICAGRAKLLSVRGY